MSAIMSAIKSASMTARTRTRSILTTHHVPNKVMREPYDYSARQTYVLVGTSYEVPILGL